MWRDVGRSIVNVTDKLIDAQENKDDNWNLENVLHILRLGVNDDGHARMMKKREQNKNKIDKKVSHSQETSRHAEWKCVEKCRTKIARFSRRREQIRSDLRRQDPRNDVCAIADSEDDPVSRNPFSPIKVSRIRLCYPSDAQTRLFIKCAKFENKPIDLSQINTVRFRQ